jgi:hypothetical protein
VNGRTFKFGLIVCALAVTASHLVLANGKFFFSDRNDSDYVAVTKIAEHPFRFRFSRCHVDGNCVVFGKKKGYMLEDVRIQVFKLERKRETGRLSTAELRDLETLQEIIHGIESPHLGPPGQGYSHSFKVSAEQFVKVVNERLGAK